MANKYGAKQVVTPEGVFDSRKEHRRWCELKLLERAGKIRDLRRQVKYVLIPSQYEGQYRKLLERECSYIADFVYEIPFHTQYENEEGHLTFADGWETVVEDVKGYKRGAAYQLFSVKRKLMLLKFGIRVVEV